MEASIAGVHYVGFWKRFIAFVVDSLLVSFLLAPVGTLLFGMHPLDPEHLTADEILRVLVHPSSLLTQLLALVAVIAFWIFRSATPGKMVIGAVIVDANSGQKPTTGQFIGRYLGYFVSTLPLGLGFFWIGWDPRKQGWHDKLAGTVVIKKT